MVLHAEQLVSNRCTQQVLLAFKALWCQRMVVGGSAGMTITFNIFKAGQPMATRAWAAPLTAAEAKKELQDINSSWIGGLRAVGSPVLLPPQHVLADGAIYELDLQEQSGGQ